MSVRYEILENNTVEVFYDDATVPSLRQPNWPNGDAWADSAEATEWAEAYVASLGGYPAKFAPNARGEAGANQPSPAQKEAIEAAQKTIQDATTLEERESAQETLNAIFKSINN